MGGSESKEEKKARHHRERMKKEAKKEREELISTHCLYTETDEKTGEVTHYFDALGAHGKPTDEGITDLDIKWLNSIGEYPRSAKASCSDLHWRADDTNYIANFTEYHRLFVERGSVRADQLNEKQLNTILSRSIDQNCYSVLEFYCIQELSLIDLWTRQDFGSAALKAVESSLSVGRLYPLKLVASYLLITKTVTEEDIAVILRRTDYRMAGPQSGSSWSSDKEAFRAKAREVMDHGIAEFAATIVATRESLLGMDCFLDDLVPLLMSFLFGGSARVLRGVDQ